MLKSLSLSQIKTTDRLQPRIEINMFSVDEYAQAMAEGVPFPPVEVVFDGESYWLWDGFHRKLAARQAGLDSLLANVTEGRLDDARWLALGANKAHGMRRSNADKRRAVELALKHPRAKTLSSNQLAQHCGVSHTLVDRIRNDLQPLQVKRTGGDGRTIDTANIGRRTTQKSPTEKLGPEIRQAIFSTDLPERRSDIQKLASMNPARQIQVAERIAAGEASTVQQAMRKIRHEQTIEVALSEVVQGRFPVILADPPWEYNNSGLVGSAEDHYPAMSFKEICEFPIQDYVAETAALFLWVTNPMLADGLKVMKAWGFAYKTKFDWVKDRATYGRLAFYNYGKDENLLLGTRGSFVPDENGLSESVIEAAKGVHSAKPDIVYEIIEKMYPGLKYLELFARADRAGWTSYGNETSSIKFGR